MTTLWQMINAQAVESISIYDGILGMTLAFILGQLAAWVYVVTHSGVSYSKSFVQSIVLLTVIVALAMMIIGNNVIVAFGLLGALSMIRFRNVLKDTRDTAFVFFALIVGIACGTGRFMLAVSGCVLFCLLLLYQHLTAFGSRADSDAFLRFQSDVSLWNPDIIKKILDCHCYVTDMITQRIGENGRMELAYQLTMRNPEGGHALVEALKSIDGIAVVTLLRQAQKDEV